MSTAVAGLEKWVLLPNFLSAEECEHLIQLGRDLIKPSMTLCPETGKEIFVPGRTSQNTYLVRRQTMVVARIEQRIAREAGFPVENGEGFQLLNYQIGEEYRPHFDYFDPERPGNESVLANGGQRVATCILYLNSVEEGGETIFPKLDLSVTPRQGDAVLFSNTLPDGKPDLLSLHGSSPVIAGEKWVATKWIRQRTFKA
jgi:prolyl 4-hydroxylase